MDDKLCAAQQQAFDTLLRLLPIGNVFVLYGGSGVGKTKILSETHQKLGGAFLNMKNFVDTMREHHPLAMEETFEQMMMEALKAHDTVIVDDFDLLNNVVCCKQFYPRHGFLNAPLLTISTYAEEAGKKLIFGCYRQAPEPVHERAFRSGIPEWLYRRFGEVAFTDPSILTLHQKSGQSEKEEYTRRGARDHGKKTHIYPTIQVASARTGKKW